MVLAWPPAASDREDHGNIGRIDLLLIGDANRPGQSAFGKCLPERSGHAIPGIGQYPAEVHASITHAVDLGKGDLGLGAIGALT
jgi:hypothetical protein